MITTVTPLLEQDFRLNRVCVLLPTYNNAGSLVDIIQSIEKYTHQIIVVNDGSTDETLMILERFKFLTVINYGVNQGKGYALKTGFRHAIEMGYEYAITIDSDGQHYASDLPIFISAIQTYPQTIIIGARNLNQENVPDKSAFGNRFSNFWFWVETGIKLPDTQSGYRAYPLSVMKNMRFFTRKYEFEIEVPVRLAWRGVNVVCVAIQVYYPPPDERISHFRPLKDFVRISILNTFLTFIALLWVHPRNFLLKISSGKGRKALWKALFVHPHESNQTKALSLAFGVLIGIFPIWGFQLLVGIPLAIYFKLNKTLFLIAANISIFPLTPVFLALSLWVGKAVLGYEDWSFHFGNMTLQQFKETGIAFFLGGMILSITSAVITYFISIAILNFFRKGTNRYL